MKINITNTDKINATLAEVNGKSESHTFTDAYEIRSVAERAEKKLAILLKKSWKGARVQAESGEALPNAYKYSRRTTMITLERCASGWFMTDCKASENYNDEGRHNLILTPEQDEEAVKRFRQQYITK